MPIQRFTRGPRILVEMANRILDDVERSTVKPGINVRVKQSPGGQILDVIQSAPSTSAAWPWKAYNTTTGATGRVQINGGDGFVATLNGKVATANSSSGPANNVKTGGVYPQVSVTANGYILGYAEPTTPGTASPLSELFYYYSGSAPTTDTASPATYYEWIIATIEDYATDGHGNVSFTLANATNYGWTMLIYCGGVIEIY